MGNETAKALTGGGTDANYWGTMRRGPSQRKRGMGQPAFIPPADPKPSAEGAPPLVTSRRSDFQAKEASLRRNPATFTQVSLSVLSLPLIGRSCHRVSVYRDTGTPGSGELPRLAQQFPTQRHSGVLFANALLVNCVYV